MRTRSALLTIVPLFALGAQGSGTNYVAGTLIQLNDNGAWSWFSDERCVVHEGKLIVGSVRAAGKYRDDTLPGWGT